LAQQNSRLHGQTKVKKLFMRKLLIGIVALVATVSAYTQDNNNSGNKYEGQSSFFAEGGGPGIMFSANFDRRFKASQLGLGARAGLGFVTAYDDYYDPVTGYYVYGDQKSAVTIPVQLNYIFGKNNSPHTFEVGAGATYVTKKLSIMNFYDDKRTQFFGTFAFMYRRQPRNGGFSWRAGFTPLIGDGLIQPFGGVSVGYSF
jgi:hypothetical protein